MSNEPHVLREVFMRDLTVRWPAMEEGTQLAFESALDGVLQGADSASLSSDMICHIGDDAPLQRIVRILSLLAGTSIAPVSATSKRQLTGRRKPRPWSGADDDRLLAAIHQHGLSNWTAVAQFVGGERTRSQCSQRWGRVLDPALSKAPWTAEDDARLMACVRNPGHGWMQVARAIGNRSDVQCKYRFHQLEKMGLAPPDLPRITSSKRPRLSKEIATFSARSPGAFGLPFLHLTSPGVATAGSALTVAPLTSLSRAATPPPPIWQQSVTVPQPMALPLPAQAPACEPQAPPCEPQAPACELRAVEQETPEPFLSRLGRDETPPPQSSRLLAAVESASSAQFARARPPAAMAALDRAL
jgi:hypothetical protein